MKELRAIACVLSFSTLAFLIYGASLPGTAASASPSVAITEPVHGAVIRGSVTVAVDYHSTTGVNVTHLEFWVDKRLWKSEKLQTPATEGTYSFVWDTTALSSGIHTVTAIAYDAKKGMADTAVSIYLDRRDDVTDAGSSGVAIAGVRDGQVVSGVTPVMAKVLDSIGVKMVMFFLNDKFLFGTNRAPYRHNWDTTKAPNGEHSLKVQAMDAALNTTEAAVTVYVNNPGGRTLPGERLSSAPQAAAPAPQPAAPREATVTPVAARQSVPGGEGSLAPLPVPVIPPTPAAPPAMASPAAPAAGPTLEVTMAPAQPRSAARAPAAHTVPPAARAAQPSLSSVPPVLDRIAVAPAPEWRSVAGFTPANPRGGDPGTRPERPSMSASVFAPATTVAGRSSLADAIFRSSGRSAGAPSGVNSRPSVSLGAMEAMGVLPIVGLGVNAPRFSPATSQPAAPAAGVKTPDLDTRAFVPEVIALATDGRVSVLAPAPGGSRLTEPRGGAGAPAVSVGQSPVMIALVDRETRRAVPVAMLMPRASEPPASQKEMPAGVRPAAPVKKLVLRRDGKAPIEVVYNGGTVKFPDVAPFTREGMLLAPFRRILEKGGGTVTWDHLVKQVKASADGRRIEFTIGNPQATVNDRKVRMETAPFVKKGRTIVPLTFVGEALDVVVEYDPASGRVTIAAK